ncbi:PEP-CTERM sorting domain-containing protein [Hassallia byssoidea VB512170]|uniref:PEP-CTERM sorting domain-containing protein n=1 Tax=Hassallia byssoidea VB512170 TaxID=1304833 RepID=A0A846H8F2_9CYAN|nr:PEP-CTERM sorting domain-containing protein [Hassalia byssoidea]NEU73238.1 PEP-CTERM sorting domain-containing protein [Hassalia byssoidea VB512170]
MVPCQFQLALWLVQTQFMAIFVAVVGLTIAATPASAFSSKADSFIRNRSVNLLNDNHTSLNLELDLTQTKFTSNETIDQLNLNQVQPYDFDTQRILTTGNQVSQLLQKAESNIEEIIQASEVSSETIDGKTFYKYHGDTNKAKNTDTYTNTWKAPASPPKRRIPEPSTILGLIAIASLFVTQRQKMKIR